MTIKALIWDFSGVICIPNERYGRRFLAEVIGVPEETLQYYFHGELNRQLNLGEIDSPTFYRIVFAELGLPKDSLEQFFNQPRPSLEINTALIDLIKELRSSKKIGLLSNYHNRLRFILENELKLANLFDDIVVSSEVKMMKPDEGIYKLALAHLGVQPQETIFVDDLTENIASAARLGIHAIQFQNNDQVIQDIRQFIPVLKSK